MRVAWLVPAAMLLLSSGCPGSATRPAPEVVPVPDLLIPETPDAPPEAALEGHADVIPDVAPEPGEGAEDALSEGLADGTEEGHEGCIAFFLDNDGDGHGLGTDAKCLDAPSPPYTALTGDDCDDSDPSIAPGAAETCNGTDDDCDGAVDEDTVDCKMWYADGDGDGFGSSLISACLCAAKAPYTVASAGDCNDSDGGVNPSASEACNGGDDDCDGLIDEEGAGGCKQYHPDSDGDGFGAAGEGACLCGPDATHPAASSTDCDDADQTIHPGAAEICNAVDDDCDGLMDEELGISTCGDGECKMWISNCVAGKPQVCVPKAPGVEGCNGLDDDCDGMTDEEGGPTWHLDLDGDGHGDPAISQVSCSAPQGWVEDGTDCDDKDAGIHPGASEVCNGEDEDCDGLTDEGVQQAYYYDADQDGWGDPESEVMACVAPSAKYVTQDGDCKDMDPSVHPAAAEVCNGKDDDCDGQTDEVDGDGDGFGPPACGGTDCDDGDAKVNPAGVEVCNGKDDDCNGKVDEGDPGVDFSTDPLHCGSCSHSCGDVEGPVCLSGACVSLPIHQHMWQGSMQVLAASGWVDVVGSLAPVTTWGGPVEIELSIPQVGGDHSACRPVVDGKWAGAFQGLPEANPWHEGLDRTGWASGSVKRMWKRTRVYWGIPAGQHAVSVQCRTDKGTLMVGRENATALWITREFLKPAKVWQQVSLQGGTTGVTSPMVKVPGTDLTIDVSGAPLEITISLPIGNGGHAGCLEWMDGAPLPVTPAYVNAFWYAGLEATYKGWIMWHHTRTYAGVKAGAHTFSIRCYDDYGTLNLGGQDMASVLIVKEIDEARNPAKQAVDAYGNGWEIAWGQDSKWYGLPNHTLAFDVKRGAIEIESHVDHYNVAAGQWFTCRPLVDGKWPGFAAGLSFAANEEEGSEKEVYEGVAWHGMWHRKRVYTGIKPGIHTVSVECLSSGAGFYAGNYSNSSLLVREADVVADK